MAMGNPNWKKGVSGNPNGRPPKDQALTDILKSKVDKDEMARLLLESARGGDLAAIKYVYDRIDGRPKETISATISELPKYVGFIVPEDEAEQKDSEADS